VDEEIAQALASRLADVVFVFREPTWGDVRSHRRAVKAKKELADAFRESKNALREKIADPDAQVSEIEARFLNITARIEALDDELMELVTGFAAEYLESVKGLSGFEKDERPSAEKLASDAMPQALFWQIYMEILSGGLEAKN